MINVLVLKKLKFDIGLIKLKFECHVCGLSGLSFLFLALLIYSNIAPTITANAFMVNFNKNEANVAFILTCHTLFDDSGIIGGGSGAGGSAPPRWFLPGYFVNYNQGRRHKEKKQKNGEEKKRKIVNCKL